MRISFRRSFLAQLLSVILACSSASWGWGNAGHEAVAYVAWQQLTPETRTRVMALLMQVPTLQSPEHKTIPGYNDWVKDLPAGLSDDEKNLYLFMRAATWPDTIKHVGFEDSDNPPKGVTEDVNIGFSDTKSHGYWHFVDAGFASDNSTVPPTPMPNAETQIAAFRTAISSGESDDLKAYDLVWLEHMVGDIHQPLHGTARYFNNKGDEGGNLVVIKLTPAMKKKFEGTVSKSAPQELHAFWDDLPGEGNPVSALPGAAAFGKGASQCSRGQGGGYRSFRLGNGVIDDSRSGCLCFPDWQIAATGWQHLEECRLLNHRRVLQQGHARRTGPGRTRRCAASKAT